jgi:hypothetical protein
MWDLSLPEKLNSRCVPRRTLHGKRSETTASYPSVPARERRNMQMSIKRIATLLLAAVLAISFILSAVAQSAA